MLSIPVSKRLNHRYALVGRTGARVAEHRLAGHGPAAAIFGFAGGFWAFYLGNGSEQFAARDPGQPRDPGRAAFGDAFRAVAGQSMLAAFWAASSWAPSPKTVLSPMPGF